MIAINGTDQANTKVGLVSKKLNLNLDCANALQWFNYEILIINNMEEYKKAQYFLAKYHALSNAAEFIRSHGDEGFAFEDKDFDKVYKRECKNTYKQLQARANIFFKKYRAMNIDVEAEIHTDSYCS
jgi:adenosine deaminase